MPQEPLIVRADRRLFAVETWLTFAGGAVIFLLIFVSVVNVLGRWLFSAPVDGYIDWIEQSMAFFAFLGVAYVQRRGEHIRMDALIGKLTGRPLWAAELLATLLILLVTLPLIYGSFLHFLRAYQIGDSSLDIGLPTWPAKLVVPLALSFLALRLFLQAAAYCRLLVFNGRPVAVPLMEDTADAARREVDAVNED